MKNMKLFVTIILTLAIVLSMAGCRASSLANDSAANGEPVIELPTEPPTDPSETHYPINENVPDITLDPGEPQGPVVIGGEGSGNVEIPGSVPQELITLRVQDVDQSVIESLIYELSLSSMGDVPMAHLRDRASLEKLLGTVGSGYLEEACAGYDANFFASYDLLIIPRVTNTGSARHTAQIFCDESSAVVQLSVEVPEIATMDMANWCLMAVIPKLTPDGTAVATGMVGMMPIVQEPIGGVGR